MQISGNAEERAIWPLAKTGAEVAKLVPHALIHDRFAVSRTALVATRQRGCQCYRSRRTDFAGCQPSKRRTASRSTDFDARASQSSGVSPLSSRKSGSAP
jgi:hypothetical protein